MRPETKGIVFLALLGDPHLDKVGGEDIALKKEVVIVLEVIEGFREAARNLGNFGEFFGREFVHVFIHGFAGIDFVQNTIQTCHEKSCVAEVRIG
jgi:hypothetical protein